MRVEEKVEEEKMAGSEIVCGGRNKRKVETLNALTIGWLTRD